MPEAKSPTKKYTQLVSTAMELFSKYGIRRVSIEEICKTSSVSKVTFYKYFSNKEDLAFTLIEKMLHDGEEKYRTIMNEDIPFAEKIERFIAFKLDYGKTLSKEFYLDWISYSPKVQQLISGWSRRIQLEFLTMLEDAQKKGFIRKSVSISFISYFLNKMNEIVRDPVLLDKYADTYTLTRDLTSFFFYGIMEKEE